MITIPITEINRFANYAMRLKTNNILPIYEYVKLECKDGVATFYKHNGHSFVVCEVSATFKKDQTVLIDEKTLFEFAHYCDSDTMTIKVTDKKIELLGVAKKRSCGTEPAIHYLAIQGKEGGDEFVFGSDVLSAMYSAKGHTKPPADKAVREWNCFVHITTANDKSVVGGFNGYTSFVQIFDEKLPKVVLDPEVVAIISKQSSVKYSTWGNYDVFEFSDIIFGFIKAESKPADFTSVVNNFKKAVPLFSIDKNHLVDFCTEVVSMNKSSIAPEVIINAETENGKIKLEFIGASDQECEDEVSVTGKVGKLEKYHFQPRYVLTTLKELSFKDIQISNLNGCFVLTCEEDKNYLGSMMSLTHNN